MNRSMFSLFFPALVVVAALVPSIAFSQPPGGGGPGGFGGPFGGGGGGLVGLVMREDVQQEIQLVDEQLDKVTQVAEDARTKMREEMRGMFEELRDLSGVSRVTSLKAEDESEL